MFSFWIGFFAFVGFLLFLDLGILHRRAKEQTFATAVAWTIGWMTIGLSFSALVYPMYEYNWLGAKIFDASGNPEGGAYAVVDYLSAYLLEQALSVDNIFVISLLFQSFRVPAKYQHRILFWGILGAIVFRVAMLGGGAYLATKFTWIFYVFGAYLAYSGFKLMRHEEDADENPLENSRTVRFLRKFVRIVDGDHGGKFVVLDRGKRALTTLAVCLIAVELTDVVFALDSIPAVLAVSQETFIIVTSNIFAIMGLRSLYFVLAGAMAKFEYLKLALAVLLILIGAKMVMHNHFHLPNVLSLGLIAGIIATGVIASIVANRKREPSATPP
jgi:tellurite resistance protein TerC